MHEAIEEHHISYDPEITEEIPRRKHQEIHGIEPNNTKLSRRMRQYDAVTKLIVFAKNWTTAYEKDFGETPDIGLSNIGKIKKSIRKEIDIMITEEHKKVQHIKGFGSRYLAGILAYAHPNRFSSLRKFLYYCGYKQSSRELKHYNRRIKPIMHELVNSIIKQKEEKYYAMYIKFKQDLRKKHPSKSKMATHSIAMNRTATFLLKEVYQLFRDVEN